MKEANKGLGCRTGSQSFSLWLVLQTLKILHAEQKQEAPGTGLIIIDTMFRNGVGFGYLCASSGLGVSLRKAGVSHSVA